MGDLEDIKRVKYRYLRALDTKHWADYADTMTDDVVGDYGSSLGEEHHFTDRNSLVEYMRTSLPDSVVTEHRVTHPEINFMLIGAAFYHDEYRKTPDGWKISVTGYKRTYDATLSLKALDFKLMVGDALA